MLHCAPLYKRHIMKELLIIIPCCKFETDMCIISILFSTVNNDFFSILSSMRHTPLVFDDIKVFTTITIQNDVKLYGGLQKMFVSVMTCNVVNIHFRNVELFQQSASTHRITCEACRIACSFLPRRYLIIQL